MLRAQQLRLRLVPDRRDHVVQVEIVLLLRLLIVSEPGPFQIV